MREPVWIFGYGSIIWRPGFDFLRREPAWLDGWARRFWQASPDHRGTPAAPGRVVTLVPEARACCAGVAFAVAPEAAGQVLAVLDARESGGFERRRVDLRVEGGARRSALVYVAPPGNGNFLGPAPLEAMGRQIRDAAGESGTNHEYLRRLATALAELGIEDPHVDGLLAAVEAGPERSGG